MAGANIESTLRPKLDRTADNERLLGGPRNVSWTALQEQPTTPEALRQLGRDEGREPGRCMLAARAIAEAEQIAVHRRRSTPSTAVWPPCTRPRRPRSARCSARDAVARPGRQKVQRFLLITPTSPL